MLSCGEGKRPSVQKSSLPEMLLEQQVRVQFSERRGLNVLALAICHSPIPGQLSSQVRGYRSVIVD